MKYNTKKEKNANFVNEQDFLKKPTEKKLKNILLSKIHYVNGNQSKSTKALHCGSYLEFMVSPDKEHILKTANFCKARLCPMCNWRLSRKRFSNLSATIEQLYKNGKYQLLFLTLTVENCYGDELRQEIKKILDAWRYMSDKNPIFKKSIYGWFRALEVTYNKKTNMYHPHLHVVLVVKSSYFNGKYYIAHENWVKMWKSALKTYYSPSVHIRKEYKNKNSKNQSTLLSEASKYVTKDSEYIIENNIPLSTRIVPVLDTALKSVRLIAYGGILKTIYEKLNLDELSYEDIINDKDLEWVLERYCWDIGFNHYKSFNPFKKSYP